MIEPYEPIRGHKVRYEPIDHRKVRWVCTCGNKMDCADARGARSSFEYHIKLLNMARQRRR